MIRAGELANRAVHGDDLGDRWIPRRGRPARPTVKANIRLPLDVYDAYCRTAQASGESLHAVLQRALIVQADTLPR